MYRRTKRWIVETSQRLWKKRKVIAHLDGREFSFKGCSKYKRITSRTQIMLHLKKSCVKLHCHDVYRTRNSTQTHCVHWELQFPIQSAVKDKSRIYLPFTTGVCTFTRVVKCNCSLGGVHLFTSHSRIDSTYIVNERNIARWPVAGCYRSRLAVSLASHQQRRYTHVPSTVRRVPRPSFPL